MKPLIPGHIPASFPKVARAERVAHTSRFLRCVRAAMNRPPDAHMANTATCAPPQISPGRMREGSAIREAIDSRTHSGFVPERRAAEPGVGAYIALFAMCASRDESASGRTQGKHRHVCATQSPSAGPATGRRTTSCVAPNLRFSGCLTEIMIN